MKQKVKKIPKYNNGTANAAPFYQSGDFYSSAANFAGQQIDNIQQSKQGVTGLGVAKGALTGAAGGAGLGLMIGGPIGAGLGAIAGGVIGGVTSGWGHGASADVNSSSTNIDDIYTPETGISGWLHDDKDDLAQAYRVQNSNYSKIHTEQIRSRYANKGIAVNPNVLVAEGGIMKKPVDALVSKGELIYNPTTKKLTKVPGSKGKPNKKDDVYARLNEGDMVISNSPTMIMANGKTPAQNLEGLVDSNKNTKAKEAIIKKVVNWQEANKTKPNDLPKYEDGTKHVKYGGEDQFMKSLEEELMKPQTPEIKGKDRRWIYHLSKAANALSDFSPLATAMLGNYDYHTEHAQVTPAEYVSANVNVAPLYKQADESYAMTRYNQANMGSSTGANMAYGLQAATDRSKQLSAAYAWQQDTQNKIIAQNAGIYNDWAKRYDAARYQAIADTRANEAAAQQMKDQAIKDGYEFYKGSKYDRWKLAMLEPMFQYAVDDKIWKNMKV